MQARLFTSKQLEFELDTHEQVEVTPTIYGFTFDSYSIWSESFEAWVKQDLSILIHNYANEYEKVLRRIETKLNERGAWQ